MGMKVHIQGVCTMCEGKRMHQHLEVDINSLTEEEALAKNPEITENKTDGKKHRMQGHGNQGKTMFQELRDKEGQVGKRSKR